MSRHTPAAALAALSIALASPAAAERLAVLELYNPAGVEQQAADFLTDRVRAGALAALGERVKVMTRENLVALLPPGADLADCAGAACEVETGRRLGAAFVVSGELVRVGPALKLSLKLHATGDGTLLAAEAASASDANGLEAALPPVVGRLVAPIARRLPVDPPFAAPVALPAVPPVDIRVGPLAATGFAEVDLGLLDALQAAHRLEADPIAGALQRAEAWAAVAGLAEGERAEQARGRAQQWRARHAAEQARAAAAREAYARYRADAEKLERLLAYDDAVVSPAQKAQWRAAFDAAYGPWRAEFQRAVRAIDWVPMQGGPFEWEGSPGPETLAPFAIARTEVTWGQYAACVEVGACPPVDWSTCAAGPTLARPLAEHFGAADQPAVCLTLDEARTFARFVGGRLPTRSEWMYAARGGRVGDGFPWGRAPADCRRAVFMDEAGHGCGRRATWPVCSRAPGESPDGLCDMVGNAAERVADGPGSKPSPFPAQRAQGPAMGGSLIHAVLDPQVVDYVDPAGRLPYLGFRVVRDAGSPGSPSKSPDDPAPARR